MTQRFQVLQDWLKKSLNLHDFNLIPASEDASFRYYYRLSFDGKTFVVMDAPPEQEDCKPFIEVSHLLQNAKVNVPTIHKMDLEQGFLLLDDFGNEHYLDNLNSDTVNKLYSDAINTLVRMQLHAESKGLSRYDETLLRREMNLFTDWLLGKHLKLSLSKAQESALAGVFEVLVENALEQPQAFVHRDFHSRNLMLVEKNNPGVIDYQDAVLGPITYDLVSLLKDCYIKWPRDEITAWLDFYLKEYASQNGETEINRSQFQRWFDLMGAQRHLKASGIFARLSHRDGKQGYLQDIPRTLSYIVDLKNEYKDLLPLCELIEETVLPQLEDKS